jgi:DNA-binding CsgD family transcriptional regulator
MPEIPPLPKEVRAFMERMRAAEQACDIHVTVGGKLTPLRDCDWVLRRPCGHVSALMHAVHGEEVYPHPASAWPELYSADPSPYVRTRDRKIRAMQAAGWTVEVLTTEDAVKAHQDSFRFCKPGCGEPEALPPPPADTATSKPDVGERRERIMLGLAQGLANKQIARREGLTFHQVRGHITAMSRHAGVSGRVALVMSALRSGELSPEDVGIEIPSGVLTPETDSDTMETSTP